MRSQPGGLWRGQQIKMKRSDLKEIDKKRVLESFVENDEALGQLLDFISSHYIQPGSQNTNMTSTASSNG